MIYLYPTKQIPSTSINILFFQPFFLYFNLYPLRLRGAETNDLCYHRRENLIFGPLIS
jgi:hypothetical protein